MWSGGGGGVVYGLDVDIGGPVQVIVGRSVSGVGWDQTNISEYFGAIGTIHHTVLILSDAEITGLTG